MLLLDFAWRSSTRTGPDWYAYSVVPPVSFSCSWFSGSSLWFSLHSRHWLGQTHFYSCWFINNSPLILFFVSQPLTCTSAPARLLRLFFQALLIFLLLDTSPFTRLYFSFNLSIRTSPSPLDLVRVISVFVALFQLSFKPAAADPPPFFYTLFAHDWRSKGVASSVPPADFPAVSVPLGRLRSPLCGICNPCLLCKAFGVAVTSPSPLTLDRRFPSHLRFFCSPTVLPPSASRHAPDILRRPIPLESTVLSECFALWRTRPGFFYFSFRGRGLEAVSLPPLVALLFFLLPVFFLDRFATARQF